MKKLFAVLFLIGTVASLKAGYSSAQGSYSQTYGYGYNPGYQYESMPYGYQYEAQPYGYGYQQSNGYGYQHSYPANQHYATQPYANQPYASQSYQMQPRGKSYQGQASYTGQSYTSGQSYATQGKAYGAEQSYSYQAAPSQSYQYGSSQYGAPQYGYQGQTNGKAARNGYSYQGQANAPQGNDQQLTAKIQDSLQSRFSDKYNNVNVSVNNGYVTLRGSVASADDKKDLEEKVRKMDGVSGVDNQVTVQNQQNSYR